MKNRVFKFFAIFLILAMALAGCVPSDNVTTNITTNGTQPPAGANVTPPTTNETTNITPPTTNVTPPTNNITPPTNNVSPNETTNVTTNITPPGITDNISGNVTLNATLNITSPDDGANVTQGNITVTVNVTNFNVVDKRGGANVEGEGHLHFYLDAEPPTTPGQPAIPANATAIWAHVANTTYTFPDVQPGTHNISVQLVNNDHTPLIPVVISTITITVEAANVTAAPVGPAPNGNVTGNNVTIPNGYGPGAFY